MAKHITHRHKIDEDQFVQKSGKLIANAIPYFEQYRPQILRGLTALAVLLVLVFLLGSFLRKSSERTNAELDDALSLAVPATSGAEGQPADQVAKAKEKLQSFVQNHTGEPAAWAHLYLGRILMAEGQTDPAIEHFRSFLSQASGSVRPLGHLSLGYALLKAGKKDEALREWEELKKQGWSADEIDLEIATLQLETDRAKAIETFQTLAGKGESPVAALAKDRLRLLAPQVDATLITQGLADPNDIGTAPVDANQPAATPADANQPAASGTSGAVTPEPPATPVEADPKAIPPVAPAEPTAAAPVAEPTVAAPVAEPTAAVPAPEPTQPAPASENASQAPAPEPTAETTSPAPETTTPASQPTPAGEARGAASPAPSSGSALPEP